MISAAPFATQERSRLSSGEGADLTALFGRDSPVTLFNRQAPPTALVSPNEATTLGVLAALGHLGLRVGEDVDVVSYDDINVSAFYSPTVSTFYQPIELLGRRLGEFLLLRMRGRMPRNFWESSGPK